MLSKKRGFIWAFLIPVIFLSTPSDGKGASRSCSVQNNFEGSRAIIEQRFNESGAAEKFGISYEMENFFNTDNGSAFKISLDYYGIGDVRKATLSDLVDYYVVGIQIQTDRRATRPAHFYFTRDGNIPLDIVAGKIWYPEYYRDGKPLEFITWFGDLERILDYGPGEEPAKNLGWILTEIGNSAQNGTLIADGAIPISHIRAARKRVEELLTEVSKSDPSRPVC